MTIEEIKLKITSTIKESFPKVVVVISTFDCPSDVIVSVFSVEPNDVRAVKDLILNLDAEVCTISEFCITPLVRNMEITEKYYPQYLSK